MKDKNKSQAVDLTQAFKSGADMSTREKEILEDIVAKTGFAPHQVIWRSSYWNTAQVSAVHYLGEFENHPAVLKIQGVKPEISEIFMIQQFAAQNRSYLIRPPRLFHVIPWNDSQNYEALIMEHISGEPVLKSKILQTPASVSDFLEIFHEYRANCLPRRPWLPRPQLDFDQQFEKLLAVSRVKVADHKFRRPEDINLCQQAHKILTSIYSGTDQEFVHGHLSSYDLVRQGNQIVLFSNLFWKWKFPFQDLVFAYHWATLELEHVSDITPDLVDSQRQLCILRIHDSKDRLYLAALLERAVAGLLVDSFMVDMSKPISQYLVDSTRTQVTHLISQLS